MRCDPDVALEIDFLTPGTCTSHPHSAKPLLSLAMLWGSVGPCYFLTSPLSELLLAKKKATDVMGNLIYSATRRHFKN